MKKIIYTGMTALALLFTGCGGDSDEASCRFAVQQNLDTGNFAAVIAELSDPSSACLSTYAASDWQIDLGASYMGLAGLGITDIVGLITAEDNGTTDAFTSLIDGVSEKQSDTALDNLGKAAAAYTAGLEGLDCTDPNITPSQQDICLFIGLAETMRATTTISFLVDDVSLLFDDSNTTAQDAAQEEMTAAMCALQFINQDTNCSDANVTATDVIFTYADANSTQKTFSDITVTMLATGKVYHELGTALAVDPGTTIVTDGYCENNFSSPSDIWSLSSPYACPLNEDPTVVDESVVELLVETLNSGLDAIIGALPCDDPLGIDCLEADVEEYLIELNTDPDTGLVDINTSISVEEIQTYLNNL